MKININNKEFSNFSFELSVLQENEVFFLENQEEQRGQGDQKKDEIIQYSEQRDHQEEFKEGLLAAQKEELKEELLENQQEELRGDLLQKQQRESQEDIQRESQEDIKRESQEGLQQKNLEKKEKLEGKSIESKEKAMKKSMEQSMESKELESTKQSLKSTEKSMEQSGHFREPLMKGKRGIIFGLANDHSLAWGIAQQLYQEGAEMAFTYQGPLMEKRVVPLAKKLGSSLVMDCDVSQEHGVKNVFDTLAQHWDSLDFIVHSVSFSDKNELRGAFIDTTRHNFLNTMAISCYSFVDMAKHGSTLMKNGGSILTLTYYGSEKVIPHYNVMGVAKAALETSVKYAAEDLGKQGIRVNALSCGPIKTLAASGIGDFRYILQWNQHNAPLRRTITLEDAGKSALFLLSDLSSGVTGENLHVDCGYHVVGMKAKDAPDIALPKTEDSSL